MINDQDAEIVPLNDIQKRALQIGKKKAEERFREKYRATLIKMITNPQELAPFNIIYTIQRSNDPLEDITVIKEILTIVCENNKTIKTPGSTHDEIYFSTIRLHFGIDIVNCAAWLVDPKFMATLLIYPNTFVDAKFRNLTPLNILAKNLSAENFNYTFDCMKLLINYGADPNLPDNLNTIPIYHIIVNDVEYEKIEEILIYFLEHSDIKLDDRTRELINNQFPNIPIPAKSLSRFKFLQYEQYDELVSCLTNDKEDDFIEQFNTLTTSHYDSTLYYDAYEQYIYLFVLAIEHSLYNAFEIIMDIGININFRYLGDSLIKHVCSSNNSKALQALLQHQDIKLRNTDNLLITALDYGYDSYFNILLEYDNIDINEIDYKGYSVLHYAVWRNKPKAVDALLKRGVYIGAKNIFNEFAISRIYPDVLEELFDSCITTNDKLSWQEDFTLKIEYSNLILPKINELSIIKPRSEMMPIKYIAKSEQLCYLLKHPLITSFLYLKWDRFSLIFYINLLVYGILWILLCVFVTQKYSNFTNNAGISTWLFVISILALVYLIIREALQLIMCVKTYMTNPINYLELLLIILTIITLSSDFGSFYNTFLAVFTILLASTEMYFLVRTLPFASTYMLMFQRVLLNFVKIITIFSFLIFGFSLCFFISFSFQNQTGNNETKSEFNDFVNPYTTIIKTIVMMTGEFDAGSINFNFSIVSYIVFTLFVFLITIVFFNLLNGLAVGDTQAIRNDAKLHGLINRTRILSKYDQIFTQNSNYMETSRISQIFCCKQIQNFKHQIRELYKKYFFLVHDETLTYYILMNNHKQYKTLMKIITKYFNDKWVGYKTQKNISKSALSIIEKRKHNFEMEKKSSEFGNRSKTIMKNEIKNNCNLMQQNFEMKIDSLNLEERLRQIEDENKNNCNLMQQNFIMQIDSLKKIIENENKKIIELIERKT